MKKVGIIGGGQLGRMMILDAKKLDVFFRILDPTPMCPAHGIADEHIVAPFDDIEAIERLSEGMDVVTYEFEHISLAALQKLESKGVKVYPSAETLGHIQNKLEQKRWLKKHDIPVPEFCEVEGFEGIRAAAERYSWPIMLKTCTGGYDGKGNALVRSEEEIAEAYAALGSGRLPLMAEAFVDFSCEVSILACGAEDGAMSIFPVAHNSHKNSILDETSVPAGIPENARQEAFAVAEQCLQAFAVCGMLCIELFVTREGHILVNELAPRPHNSGHYTIEGCPTSQFEQHIRAITGYPLGGASLQNPCAMKNLIGDRDGTAEPAGIAEALAVSPAVKVHLYGKEQVRKGRKMGHITASAESVEEALSLVRRAHEMICI